MNNETFYAVLVVVVFISSLLMSVWQIQSVSKESYENGYGCHMSCLNDTVDDFGMSCWQVCMRNKEAMKMRF